MPTAPVHLIMWPIHPEERCGERADINYLHISCSSYVIVPFTIPPHASAGEYDGIAKYENKIA